MPYQTLIPKIGTNYKRRLTWLYCGYNSLTSLDVSNNTQLKELSCSYNPGKNGVFTVYSWFDNASVPSYFTTGSWDYNGSTVTINYVKK